jgi:hypothetical protein
MREITATPVIYSTWGHPRSVPIPWWDDEETSEGIPASELSTNNSKGLHPHAQAIEGAIIADDAFFYQSLERILLCLLRIVAILLRVAIVPDLLAKMVWINGHLNDVHLVAIFINDK